MEIKRALISVYKKDGIEKFAKFLADRDVHILATGNTHRFLTESGIAAQEVSDYTGAPEILNGRVKTLHYKVHGGILSMRDDADQEIDCIDLVVVDLYPFYEALNNPEATHEELVEKIDIGGVTLLRSAAKNSKFVLAVSDVSDYDDVISKLSSGLVDVEYRKKMAAKAFALTSEFDSNVAKWMYSSQSDGGTPEFVSFTGRKVQDLRCGENPHQTAGLFSFGSDPFCGFKQLSGKKLSYNNIADMVSAYGVVSDFSEPAAAIVKHCNPCGVAVGKSVHEAYLRAFSSDEVSSFGGCIAINCTVDEALALEIMPHFFEIVIAPEFDDAAIKVLSSKKNIRLIAAGASNIPKFAIKPVFDGFMLQDQDVKALSFDDLKCVTQVLPSDQIMSDLIFAWKVCKHVKSNAVVIARNGQTIGIGAGQMSRIDSVEIAIKKGVDCKGAVLASDGFFPFSDSIVALANAGITAVIQPGGSIRDGEVIEAANLNGLSMVFTGRRLFLH